MLLHVKSGRVISGLSALIQWLVDITMTSTEVVNRENIMNKGMRTGRRQLLGIGVTVARGAHRARASLGLMALVSASQCFAAAVDQGDFARLKAEAQLRGAAPVMVHLESVSLDALKKNPAAVAVSVRKKADALIAQLGPQAWAVGRSANGAGQISLYLTSSGLDVLAATGLARSFFLGQSWRDRSGLSDGGDGAIEEIDRRLDRDGFVDLVVVPQINGLKHVIDRSNKLRFVAGPQERARAKEVATALRMMSGRTDGPTALPGAAADNEQDVRFSVRVDRQGLLRLVESGLVMNIRPAGHVDARATFIDPVVVEDLKNFGQTRVLISMRSFFGGGKMDAGSWTATAAANKQALGEMLGSIAGREGTRDLTQFGMVGATITAAELDQLQRSKDGRLLSVISAKPSIRPFLSNVNSAMNTDQLRTKGYIAAQQAIVLLDAGVEKTHPFLTQGGVSKVTYEACFGTNLTQGADSYTSPCPVQNPSGDSSPGTVGSGIPIGSCAAAAPGGCSHGTHLAGILVGKSSTINGLAQGASLASVQVYSKFKHVYTAPTPDFLDIVASPLDIAAGLNYLNSLLPIGTTAAAYTVVVGGGATGAMATQTLCDASVSNIGATIQALKNAGVPVVSASMDAGISGYNIPQSFPACVSNVIKVGATNNDGVGNTISSITSLFPSSRFPSGQFFLAPGAGAGVNSSVNGGAYATYGGTSQSAAAVAALYAVYKSAVPGATVDDVTNFLLGNAVGITKSFDCMPPVNGVPQLPCSATFQRVRLPNL